MKYDFTDKLMNIDTTFRCPNECPRCQRTALISQGLKIPGVDMPIEDFYKIINYFKKIQFCGAISDPTANPKMIEMLKYCYKHNNKTFINTAASHKSKKWYEQAFDANPKAVWTFGVDGLPKDSHKHRINQDGEKLFKMMKMGVKKGLCIRWQYIVFRYNEYDIEEARQMAKDNGIKFDLQFSGRWYYNDKYKPRNPNYYLNSTNYNLNGYQTTVNSAES